MTDPAIREMLGPDGAAALIEAQRTILSAHPEARVLTLTWLTWTPTAWQFTFLQRRPARRYQVEAPHSGTGLSVRVREPSDRPGSGPLGD